MTARERRQVVRKVQAAAGVSEPKAVRFTGFARSTIRYRSKREPQEELRTRIRALAAERPRWGYRMLHMVLRREGWAVNRKRVQRLYREEGLVQGHPVLCSWGTPSFAHPRCQDLLKSPPFGGGGEAAGA